MEDVFDVQDEIGVRVVESLQTRFCRGVPKSRDRYSSDPEAYNEFMAGLRESYSIRHETLDSAIRHLSKAVERDPEFALAHAWLSYVSMNIYFSFDPSPARLEAAEHHYHKALAIDPVLPEANLARAFILWSAAKNFQHADAIAALELVLAAQPNSEQAHNRMSSICLHIGRFEEARIAHEKAQRAHPSKKPGILYLWSGDFAQAETAGEAWIRESPGDHQALWFHPQPPLMAGNVDLAERRLLAGLKIHPDEPRFISLQGMVHAQRNESDPAHECALRALTSPRSDGHTHHTYYQVACIYALLGKTDEAMAWLERTADTGFPCWPFFKLDPHLANLREMPAFKKLVDDLKRRYTAINIQRL
jgi:tetratricopeptide (TPR) repeat protein